MMNLSDAINLKYPAELQSGLIKLQDDGEGAYIKEWNIADPQPDVAVLLSDAGLLAQYQFEQNKITNQPILDQLDVIDLKSIRALLESDTNRIQQYNTQKTALRAQLLPTS